MRVSRLSSVILFITRIASVLTAPIFSHVEVCPVCRAVLSARLVYRLDRQLGSLVDLGKGICRIPVSGHRSCHANHESVSGSGCFKAGLSTNVGGNLAVGGMHQVPRPYGAPTVVVLGRTTFRLSIAASRVVVSARHGIEARAGSVIPRGRHHLCGSRPHRGTQEF